jgi:UDP-N-acetylmuramate-alanine ligase
VVDSARRQGARQMEHAPDAEAAVAAVVAEARAGDTVLTLGAGDVWKLSDEILRRLRGAGVAGVGR